MHETTTPVGDDESLDTLYRAMEMSETAAQQRQRLEAEAVRQQQLAAAVLPTTVATPRATATGASSTASLHQPHTYQPPGPSPNNNNNPVPPPQQQTQSEEYDTWFLWELLEFAQKRSWKKKLLTVLIVVSSILVLSDVFFFGNVVNVVNHVLAWAAHHTFLAVIGSILFIAAATLVFVPHALLCCGAGWAFADVCGMGVGVVLGLFVSFMGSCLGAVLAFLRSRYMMRDLVELFSRRYPIVKAADRALARKGYKIMLLLRLCPLIPFNGLNYIGGVTSCSLEAYTQALVGILPITLLWVSVGASAENIKNRSTNDAGEQIFLVALLVIGFFCGAAGLSRVYKVARDELKKEILLDKAASWHRYKASSSELSTASALADDDDAALRDQGVEVLSRADLGFLAVLGIESMAVEALQPPGQDDDDDDPFWIFA